MTQRNVTGNRYPVSSPRHSAPTINRPLPATHHSSLITHHSSLTSSGKPAVQQCQLDRLRQYASRMGWTADQLDRWIQKESQGKCKGLKYLRTAKAAEYLCEVIAFFYDTRTEDYLARQRALRK